MLTGLPELKWSKFFWKVMDDFCPFLESGEKKNVLIFPQEISPRAINLSIALSNTRKGTVKPTAFV